MFVFVIDAETPLSDVVSDFDLNCRRFRYLVERGWVKRSENERFRGWKRPGAPWRRPKPPWRRPKLPAPNVSGDLKQIFRNHNEVLEI